MSQPRDLQMGLQLSTGSTPVIVHFVNTGVPHAVVAVGDLETMDVRTLGAALRWHEHFAPKGTNANFIQQLDPQTLAIRTFERGVEDETLACGTGVVASALVHHRLTGAASPVRIKVRGGDVLEVGFQVEDGEYRNVTLTGPADFVFDGRVAL
jgi:diaminopimelate epimerase